MSRSGSPDGARQTAEALPYDLNGRITHYWVTRNDQKVSTLDLIGVGLTVLRGPGNGEIVPPVPAGSGDQLPVVNHVVDENTADALGIEHTGALVVRPDGRPL